MLFTLCTRATHTDDIETMLRDTSAHKSKSAAQTQVRFGASIARNLGLFASPVELLIYTVYTIIYYYIL